MPSSANRLSQLDGSFLVLETPNAHMHVAALQVFEPGPLVRADGSLDIELIRAYIESRLHLIPRYRQRLSKTPIESQPMWVDDAGFNIRYHVRHSSLPKPGSREQLKRLAARIMSQQLDRGKPLWEMWVVEGLEGGNIALISKTHHCMIDGISGVDIMTVLMDVEPKRHDPEPHGWYPEPPPTTLELLADSAFRVASIPLDILRSATGIRRETLRRVRALGRTLATGFAPASETPLNRPIGPHRRFAHITFEIADVKAVKRSLGGSLNDVVLATVSGALRRFLEIRRVDPAELRFRVMAPVSVRHDDERGAFGNRVSGWFIDLPLDTEDPRQVLGRISVITERLKESKQALGAEMLTQVSEWTGGTLLNVAARMAKRTLSFNMVVTNVPGPQVPLYLLGARMVEAYPMVPLFVNQGLGIALFSYAGKLMWGINADWDLVPDLETFVGLIDEAFGELCSVAGVSRSDRPAEAPATDLGRVSLEAGADDRR